ncbi:MAG: GyrI-like domain-containing protein [Bacteroidia bacterium]
MKKLKIILAIFALLIIIGFIYAGYLNAFSHVNVEDKTEGGYKLVGLDFTGPYSKVGKFMMDAEKKLSDNNIKSPKGFGIYYDDPKITPEEKCRSFVGDILLEKDFNQIPKLKSLGFKIDSIPESPSVVAYFPIKSPLSYMIGPMKVYPEITKYMTEKNYKSNLSLEVYDADNKMIMFVMQYKK